VSLSWLVLLPGSTLSPWLDTGVAEFVPKGVTPVLRELPARDARVRIPSHVPSRAPSLSSDAWYDRILELKISKKSLLPFLLSLLLSTPFFSAYVSLDPVRSSSTWAFTGCLRVCSSSPFLGPWGASA